MWDKNDRTIQNRQQLIDYFLMLTNQKMVAIGRHGFLFDENKKRGGYDSEKSINAYWKNYKAIILINEAGK